MKSGNSDNKISEKDDDLNGRKKNKKSVGVFAFIFSLVLLVGIECGMWGAYYVIKTGWENIPFTEKIEFLPIVKLDKHINENFQEPAVEANLQPISEGDVKKNEEVETNSD